MMFVGCSVLEAYRSS